jgi:hypothetical protein
MCCRGHPGVFVLNLHSTDSTLLGSNKETQAQNKRKEKTKKRKAAEGQLQIKWQEMYFWRMERLQSMGTINLLSSNPLRVVSCLPLNCTHSHNESPVIKGWNVSTSGSQLDSLSAPQWAYHPNFSPPQANKSSLPVLFSLLLRTPSRHLIRIIIRIILRRSWNIPLHPRRLDNIAHSIKTIIRTFSRRPIFGSRHVY